MYYNMYIEKWYVKSFFLLLFWWGKWMSEWAYAMASFVWCELWCVVFIKISQTVTVFVSYITHIFVWINDKFLWKLYDKNTLFLDMVYKINHKFRNCIFCLNETRHVCVSELTLYSRVYFRFTQDDSSDNFINMTIVFVIIYAYS